MRKILIVGATSGMAEACARLWAQRGDHLFLAARNLANVLVVEPRYADPLSLVFYKKVLVTKA